MGVAVAQCLAMDSTRHVVRYSAPEAEPVELFAECSAGVVQNLTPWLAFLAPVAARQGHDLVLEGEVDEVALSNARQAVRLLHSWFPDISDIEVSGVGNVMRRERVGGGWGCFFSGGVDSFYSVMTARERITHIVFVHGFDIALENSELAGRVKSELRDSARNMNLPLLEVSTNIRSLSDPVGLEWGAHFHGAALGAVAQLLAPHVGGVLVPSTLSMGHLPPWGSHPDLDPLWSSGAVAVEHHGAETLRPQKVARLAGHPEAMRRLRVCWENPDSSYNCGSCNKCTRTLVDLRIAGVEGLCSTLPNRLDLDRVPELGRLISSRLFLRESLAEMAQNGRPDPELRSALRKSLWSGAARSLTGRARGRLRRTFLHRGNG